MVALETSAFDQSYHRVSLYAVNSETGVVCVRSRYDWFIKQTGDMRGHCTTHVLRDRQLAANHRANHPSRLFFRKYKNRAIKERRSCRLIPLPRFRFVSRTRVHAFSRPNSPLAFPCPERQACLTNRNAARSSNRSVNGFFFFSFSKHPVYCTGVCIIFALIMQVG